MCGESPIEWIFQPLSRRATRDALAAVVARWRALVLTNKQMSSEVIDYTNVPIVFGSKSTF